MQIWLEKHFIAHHIKSHTCKEGRAHLRISFSHLLMNFEKPEKSEFWKNEKKLLETLFYTCVPKTTTISGTVPEIQSETECFVILGHFFALLPFCPFALILLKNTNYTNFFCCNLLESHKIPQKFLKSFDIS